MCMVNKSTGRMVIKEVVVYDENTMKKKEQVNEVIVEQCWQLNCFLHLPSSSWKEGLGRCSHWLELNVKYLHLKGIS